MGRAKVTLGNETTDGAGTEDIAWDAIAIEPLSAKPKDIVVSMGDSYSSGEGASQQSNPSDYYKETDVDGGDKSWRDACHRSPYAWSRKATLADSANTIGSRADGFDDTLDYHLIACSGAQTKNILGENGPGNAWGLKAEPEYSELPQLDEGYLDQNTTLVTLSIGGNDARFSDIVKLCIENTAIGDCSTSSLSADKGVPLEQAEPAVIEQQVRPSITTVLQEIHKRAPSAKIVLMGYPILLEPALGCPPGISAASRDWMNKMSGVLNTQMQAAADDATSSGAGTQFADPRGDFAGKAICGDPESIHGVVVDKTPGDDPDITNSPVSAQSFHPKVQGTTLYSDTLNRALRAIGM